MKGKILVVDNDLDCLEIFEILLEAQGYQVKTATTPEIIRFASAYQLIILDENLGSRRGSDVCTSLKWNPETANIPVVLTSAMDSLKEIGRSCQADYVLEKPFNVTELENLVERILG